MKISICGIEHEVVESEDNFDTEIHMGQIDYGNCVIKINKNISRQLKAATLCHEILHGMLVYIGREDLSSDEQLVTALGNAINGSFKVRWKGVPTRKTKGGGYRYGKTGKGSKEKAQRQGRTIKASQARKKRRK